VVQTASRWSSSRKTSKAKLGHARGEPSRGGLKVAAVKAPGFGDRRKAMLQGHRRSDRCQAISEDLGIKLET